MARKMQRHTEETRRKMSITRKGRVGPDSPRWKGGRRQSRGYIWVWIGGDSYIQERRFIMENFLGRNLLSNEIVHHKNGDIADNRLENLQPYDKIRTCKASLDREETSS